MTDPYAGFAPFYDAWASRMTEDVEFYVRRALDAAGPVVELGAGTGRISIPIAQAGRAVVAVEPSPAMIALGRRHAEAAGVGDRITWIEDRMQSFVADPPVELVAIPFRAFIHLTTTDEQRAALAAIRASLTAGGRLVLNLFVPDPAIIVEHDRRRVSQGTFLDERGRAGELLAEQRYRPASQRLHVRAICEVREGGEIVETQTADLEARLVYRYEMEHLLARAGFEIEALYGWFDERPFDDDSREMIWVARRS